MHRILAHLYSQPLLMEQRAWDSFALRFTDQPAPAAPARACINCDDPPSPSPRYFDVLELRTLAPVAPLLPNDLDFGTPIPDTAIITFNGALVKHFDRWECRIFGLTDLDDVDAALAHIAADANIRNVLLNFVNCPGGGVIGMPETAARVRDLVRSKNVIAFSDSVICSAGIYIGTQASEFFVTESAFSGSIGIIRPPILDMSKNLEMNGVTPTVIKSGKFKDTGTSLRPPTPEEIAMLQAQSDRIKKMFVDAVKAARPRMGLDAMQGQVFFGSEAVEVGLADAVVADMTEALAAF